MNSQKMPLKNSLCLLLAATIWGIAFVAQSVGMEYVGPFTFNGVRSLIGAAVLVPVLFILNRSGNKIPLLPQTPQYRNPHQHLQKKLYPPRHITAVTCGWAALPADLLFLLPAASSSLASSTQQ